MVNTQVTYSTDELWQAFSERHTLTMHQLEQFKQYYDLLIKTNDIHNLTAITELEKVMNDHFDDSLALSSFIQTHAITSLADVGTGGGFPGIPLKIKFPHMQVLLIEVTQKKIEFLQMVIDALGLKNIDTCSIDWRTFLRNTSYSIQLFCARASLQPSELIRIFKPLSAYTNALLVYWASKSWQPLITEAAYIGKEIEYTVGDKTRRLIFFSLRPLL